MLLMQKFFKKRIITVSLLILTVVALIAYTQKSTVYFSYESPSGLQTFKSETANPSSSIVQPNKQNVIKTEVPKDQTQSSNNQISQIDISQFSPSSIKKIPAELESSDTYYGVYFSTLNYTLDNLEFRLKKEDESYTEYFKPHIADGIRGDELAVKRFVVSDVFTYPDGFVAVETKNAPADIKIDLIKKDQTGIAKSSTAVSFEKEFKDKFWNKIGIDIVTREEWGAPSYSLWTPAIYDVNRIVIHHTATNEDLNNPANTVKAIYDSHYYRCADNSGSYNSANPNCDEIDELWTDIGYNYLISSNGTIFEGRAGGNGVVGAHAVPNSRSIGIAIIGDYTGIEPTAASLNSLKRLMAALSVYNELGNLTWENNVFAHRHYLNTACPGNSFYPILPNIVSQANELKNTFTHIQTYIEEIELWMSTLVYQIDGVHIKMSISKEGLTTSQSSKLANLNLGMGKTTDRPNAFVIFQEEHLLKEYLMLLKILTDNAEINFATEVGR